MVYKKDILSKIEEIEEKFPNGEISEMNNAFEELSDHCKTTDNTMNELSDELKELVLRL